VFDFELEEADMQIIADLKGCVGYAARSGHHRLVTAKKSG
jgi:hypothetical protein